MGEVHLDLLQISVQVYRVIAKNSAGVKQRDLGFEQLEFDGEGNSYTVHSSLLGSNFPNTPEP